MRQGSVRRGGKWVLDVVLPDDGHAYLLVRQDYMVEYEDHVSYLRTWIASLLVAIPISMMAGFLLGGYVQ